MPAKSGPLEAEAEDQGIQISFGGVTWTLPPKSQWRLSTIVALEANEIKKGFESLLGPEQWQKLLELDPTVDELQEFTAAIIGAVGGNS